jgi:site-specific DNA-cytosine methylase
MLKEHSPQTMAKTLQRSMQAFANIGGYRLEWQLLNTKWFLPQNRERIYLVGYLGGQKWRTSISYRRRNKSPQKEVQVTQVLVIQILIQKLVEVE